MKRGTVNKLDNFYGSGNKSVYRVSEHAVTVSLSWNSELSVLEDITTPFYEDRFRFHSYEVFEANCDLKGDLYGTLALTSMSSSRVFIDFDVQPTIEYFAWPELQYKEEQRCQCHSHGESEVPPPVELKKNLRPQAEDLEACRFDSMETPRYRSKPWRSESRGKKDKEETPGMRKARTFRRFRRRGQ
ncbi:hypothetical protein YC2023_081933 [Brassica napus]